jgi:hypothetical protein
MSSSVNVEGFNTTYQEVTNLIDQNDDYVKTASNTGTGSEVFKQKSAQDLQFRKLKSNTLTITQNADDISIEEDGKQQLDDGDQTTPSLYFTNSTNSGIYKESTYGIGFTTNGTQRMHIHGNYIELMERLYAASGLVSSPGITYAADTDTGMYLAGQNDMRMVANGADVCGIDSSFTLYKPLTSIYQTCLSWKRTTTASITSNTATILDFPTAEMKYETADITYSSSPIKYTINKAGRYLISYEVNMNADTSDRFVYSWIEINGSGRYSYILNTIRGASGNNHSIVNTNVFDLSATNTINVVLYNSGFTMTSPYSTSYANRIVFYRLS